MADSDSHKELNDRIVQKISGHWDKNGTALLLSKLGAEDNGEIAKLTKEQHVSLKAYLHNKLQTYVKVIQHTSKPQVIGAVPATVKIDDYSSVDELLPTVVNEKTDAVIRYHPALWAAFIKPLDDSKTRYITVTDVIRFVDVPPEEKPEGHIEVDKKLVLHHIEKPTAKKVEKNILSWIEDNGLEASSFWSKKPSAQFQFPSNDLLAKLLESLGTEDLRRISMPLDIVRTLRSQQL